MRAGGSPSSGNSFLVHENGFRVHSAQAHRVKQTGSSSPPHLNDDDGLFIVFNPSNNANEKIKSISGRGNERDEESDRLFRQSNRTVLFHLSTRLRRKQNNFLLQTQAARAVISVTAWKEGRTKQFRTRPGSWAPAATPAWEQTPFWRQRLCRTGVLSSHCSMLWHAVVCGLQFSSFFMAFCPCILQPACCCALLSQWHVLSLLYMPVPHVAAFHYSLCCFLCVGDIVACSSSPNCGCACACMCVSH